RGVGIHLAKPRFKCTTVRRNRIFYHYCTNCGWAQCPPRSRNRTHWTDRRQRWSGAGEGDKALCPDQPWCDFPSAVGFCQPDDSSTVAISGFVFLCWSRQGLEEGLAERGPIAGSCAPDNL